MSVWKSMVVCEKSGIEFRFFCVTKIVVLEAADFLLDTYSYSVSLPLGRIMTDAIKSWVFWLVVRYPERH